MGLKRDISIDVAKGILIILMLIGHVGINKYLWAIIYSFHMVAFIFFVVIFIKKLAI